jgi:hypothetical protein
MRQTQIGDAVVPYYQSEKYSTWVLATGDTGFRPFNNVESQNLRNYNKGQNLFQNNQGRILALKAEIHGADFGTLGFPMTAKNTAPPILTELNKLIAQARIQVQQDSQVVHESLMSSLVEPLPKLIYPFEVGTVTNSFNMPDAVQPNDSSIMVKRSQKVGIYWTPPLFVAQGRTIDFSISLPGNYSVPSSIANICVKFLLVTEEIPQSNLSQVR